MSDSAGGLQPRRVVRLAWRAAWANCSYSAGNAVLARACSCSKRQKHGRAAWTRAARQGVCEDSQQQACLVMYRRQRGMAHCHPPRPRGLG